MTQRSGSPVQNVGLPLARARSLTFSVRGRPASGRSRSKREHWSAACCRSRILCGSGVHRQRSGYDRLGLARGGPRRDVRAVGR